MNDEYDFSDDAPPNEYRVEQQDLRILKGITSDPKIARTFCRVYDHNLFIGTAKNVAKPVIDYWNTYKNIPTQRVLVESAGSNANLASEIEYVYSELEGIKFNESEFGWDLDKLKDRLTRKTFCLVRDEIESLGDDASLDETLRKIRQSVERTQTVRAGKEQVYIQKTLREHIPEFKKEYEAKLKDPELGRGILTGYAHLDYITNGLMPSDMVIIAAESGAGKSFFLNNLAIQMWMQQNTICTSKSEYTKGNNVLYFSLEMPYDQCFRRTMSRLAEVSSYALRDAKIQDEEELKRLGKAASFMYHFPNDFEIVDIPRGVTVEQIEERYLESISRGNDPNIVVVDYIGLMESSEKESDDWLKLGHISAKLHEFARRYNLIVLTAAQLNRTKGKSNEEKIGMHRIGRSSQIIHNASIGIQIESRDNESTYSDLLYHVIKNRNGELGKYHLNKKLYQSALLNIPYESDILGAEKINDPIGDISDIVEKIGWT
jgi:replicative DNA helicase